MMTGMARICAMALMTCFACLPLCIQENGPTTSQTSDTTAQSSEQEPQPSRKDDETRKLRPLPKQLQDLLSSSTPLNPSKTVRVDLANNKVLLHTQVACEDCLLEMLCCTEETKEHESILWLRSRANVVHAALLAVNAKPGKAAVFTPSFAPPSGQKIDIYLNWVDKHGKLKREKAQSWMRHSINRYYGEKLAKPPEGIEFPHMELRYDPYNKEIIWFGEMKSEQRDKLLKLCAEEDYQKAIKSFYRDSQPREMKAEFVFTGSYHYVPEGQTESIYAADGGFLICVANFASAMIDVKEASSAQDGGRSYEAWPGRVPPQHTPVIVELVPVADPQAANVDSIVGPR